MQTSQLENNIYRYLFDCIIEIMLLECDSKIMLCRACNLQWGWGVLVRAEQGDLQYEYYFTSYQEV